MPLTLGQIGRMVTSMLGALSKEPQCGLCYEVNESVQVVQNAVEGRKEPLCGRCQTMVFTKYMHHRQSKEFGRYVEPLRTLFNMYHFTEEPSEKEHIGKQIEVLLAEHRGVNKGQLSSQPLNAEQDIRMKLRRIPRVQVPHMVVGNGPAAQIYTPEMALNYMMRSAMQHGDATYMRVIEMFEPGTDWSAPITVMAVLGTAEEHNMIESLPPQMSLDYLIKHKHLRRIADNMFQVVLEEATL